MQLPNTNGTEGEVTAWRDGAWVVVRLDRPRLPARCMRTNRALFEPEMHSRRLGWSGTQVPLAGWVNLVLQLATMRYITVNFGVAETELARRRWMMVLAVGGLALGGALFGYGLSLGFPGRLEWLGPGAVVCIFALTLLANEWTIVDVKHMDAEHAWLTGAKEPFLQTLPPFNNRRRLPS